MSSSFLATGNVAFEFRIGNFDCDLLIDPYHPKRFSHLQTIAADLPEADQFIDALCVSTNQRDYYFVVFAFITSVVTYWSASQFLLLSPVDVSARVVSIALQPRAPAVENKRDTPAPSAAETQVTKNPTAKVDRWPENLSREEKSAQEQNPNQEDILPSETPAPTPILNLKDQVSGIVNNMNTPNEEIPVTGLRAPGIVVDRHLRELLNSERIVHLNGSRLPEEALIGAQGKTLTKIGERCFLTSLATQGGAQVELPLIGNGWNLNYFREVNCGKYFQLRELDRSDVQIKLSD